MMAGALVLPLTSFDILINNAGHSSDVPSSILTIASTTTSG